MAFIHFSLRAWPIRVAQRPESQQLPKADSPVSVFTPRQVEYRDWRGMVYMTVRVTSQEELDYFNYLHKVS